MDRHFSRPLETLQILWIFLAEAGTNGDHDDKSHHD